MHCVPGFELFSMALARTGANYLEIGVFNGDSISKLATWYPHKIIYGIDPFIEDGYTSHETGAEQGQHIGQQEENTLKNINGLENIVLFKMTSKEFVEILTDEMVKVMEVSHVLIDGSHHYEDVVTDAELAVRLLDGKPGIIVFDDANLPGVDQARHEFVVAHNDKINGIFDCYSDKPGHIIAYFMNGHPDANYYYNPKKNN
jgi:hypothetical protein